MTYERDRETKRERMWSLWCYIADVREKAHKALKNIHNVKRQKINEKWKEKFGLYTDTCQWESGQICVVFFSFFFIFFFWEEKKKA